MSKSNLWLPSSSSPPSWKPSVLRQLVNDSRNLENNDKHDETFTLLDADHILNSTFTIDSHPRTPSLITDNTTIKEHDQRKSHKTSHHRRSLSDGLTVIPSKLPLRAGAVVRKENVEPVSRLLKAKGVRSGLPAVKRGEHVPLQQQQLTTFRL